MSTSRQDRVAGLIFEHTVRASEHTREQLRGLDLRKAGLRRLAGLKDTEADERTFRRAMQSIQRDLEEHLWAEVGQHQLHLPDPLEGLETEAMEEAESDNPE